MEVNFPTIDAATQIRDYRENYVNFNVLAKNMQMPESMKLMTPKEQPIMDLDLPSALRDAMVEFEKSGDGQPCRAVKYMRIANGSPDLVIEDESPLPEESDIVTFSHTVSVVSLNVAKVITHQLVATVSSSKGEIL